MGGQGITRRDLLRQGALGTLALSAAGGVLAACAAGRSAAPKFPAEATTAPPDDARTRWWLEGNFAPVHREVTATNLEVIGSLPPELEGLYARNGSNPLSGLSPHWFLGDGMVHGVELAGGAATWYRNRYVETALWESGGGLGSSGQPGGASGLSNVSVGRHAGRFLSLGEVGFPFELEPSDLSTLGVVDFDGRLTGNFTAHPKVDPTTGVMHAFGYNFEAPFLEYYVIDPSGTLVSSEPVDVPHSTMMHDFAITESDVIFMDFPVAFDMAGAIKMVKDPSSTAVPFEWRPELGARLGVMPLGGPTSAIRWVSIDPCYVYHGVNAWRDGSVIKMEVCHLDSTFTSSNEPSAATRRVWSIETATPQLRFSEVILDVPAADLPTIDQRHRGRPSRHSWLGEVISSPGELAFWGCQHLDTVTGRLDRWLPDGGRRSGEWCFVPAKGGHEGEGWVMAFVFDPRVDRSALVVLEAQDVAKGPIAQVPLPVRVPYGFHGTFMEA